MCVCVYIHIHASALCLPVGYLPHIGALLVSPIAQKCSKQGKDVRTADLSTLREVTGGLYSEQELERLAFFLKQEVSRVPYIHDGHTHTAWCSLIRMCSAIEYVTLLTLLQYPEPSVSVSDLLSCLQPLVKVSMKLVHKEVVKMKVRTHWKNAASP